MKLANCKTMSHFLRKCVLEKEIYIVDSFLETDEKVVINYENYFYKRNYYYFQNNVMPKNYKKYDN